MGLPPPFWYIISYEAADLLPGLLTLVLPVAKRKLPFNSEKNF